MLQEGLRQVGDSAGGFGLYLAGDHGGDEAREGGAEIVGGEVVSGEGSRPGLCRVFPRCGRGLFFGRGRSRSGMVAESRGTATATIGEGEYTRGCVVVLLCDAERPTLLTEDIRVSF
jgi:hypothetical protein